jgi:hypothetical protein
MVSGQPAVVGKGQVREGHGAVRCYRPETRMHGPLAHQAEYLPFKPLPKIRLLGKPTIYQGVFICLVGWRGVVLGQLHPLAGTVMGTVGHKFRGLMLPCKREPSLAWSFIPVAQDFRPIESQDVGRTVRTIAKLIGPHHVSCTQLVGTMGRPKSSHHRILRHVIDVLSEVAFSLTLAGCKPDC